MAKDEPTCPGWLMTFGDVMGLLLTFFVMMLTFTDFDQYQLSEFLGAMKGGLSLKPDILSRVIPHVVENGQEQPTLLSADEVATLGARVPGFAQMFSDVLDERFKKQVFFRVADEGIAIVIQSESLFKPGTAELLGGQDSIFKSVGNLVVGMDNEVRVTAVVGDNVAYDLNVARSGWGFAAKRAAMFQRNLSSVSHVPEDRFGLGARVVKRTERLASKTEEVLPDYIEVLVAAKRQIREATPEEIVIKDRWLQ